MNAKKLVRMFVEAYRGKIVTPHIVTAWGASHGWTYSLTTIAGAMRELLPRQCPGHYIAVIVERQRLTQAELFS